MNANHTHDLTQRSTSPINERVNDTLTRLSSIGIVPVSDAHAAQIARILEDLYIDAWGDCEDDRL